jgi:hypothetical protein
MLKLKNFVKSNKIRIINKRKDGRVVECFGFENRRTCKGTEGSNPSLSVLIDVEILF